MFEILMQCIFIFASVSLLSSEVLPVTEERSQEGSTSDVMGTAVSYGGVKAPFLFFLDI